MQNQRGKADNPLQDNKDSFIKGALILTIAGFIVKILGAIYRIPLARILGDEGIGIYQLAYPIYGTLLAISTAGLPTAISKLVAEDTALGMYKNAQRIFKISLMVLAIIGFLLSAILMGNAETISIKALCNPKAYYSVLSIAPAIFFVSIMSCFRGYFQGLQNMIPSAISQVAEQIGRVVAVFVLVVLLLPKGIEYAAAGAAFGPVVGSIVGLLVLMFFYILHRRQIRTHLRQDITGRLQSPFHIIYRLFSFAIPITLGGLLMPIMSLADSIIVNRRLQFAGFSTTRATELFGQLSGKAMPLINFPATVTMSLAASLVPAISEAMALKQQNLVAKRSQRAIRITLIFALPAAVGMFVLAKPIATLLYKSPEAGTPLAVLSWSVIFLSLSQTTTGILQGIGKTYVPLINLAIGTFTKIVLNYWLTAIPSINIKGAALGSVVGYMIPALLNFLVVVKLTGLELNMSNMFIKPIIATSLMGVSVNFIFERLIHFGTSQNKATLMGIALGGFSYIVYLFLLGGLDKSDFEILPGGKKLVRVLNKLGFFRR